jgi:Ca2+-binding EF-hand superfamily protein
MMFVMVQPCPDDLRDLFQRMDVDGKQLINAQQFSRVLRSYNRHGKCLGVQLLVGSFKDLSPKFVEMKQAP